MDLFSNNLGLMLLGIIFAVEILMHLCKGLNFTLKCHIIPRIIKEDLVKKYGPWAVITGASFGIGSGIAKELASRGFNTLLISRSRERLSKVASEIESEFGVKTKIIACDLSTRNSYDFILEQISGMDIGILVNNVGISNDNVISKPYFHQTELDLISRINTINCGAAFILIKGILPRMILKRKGVIVNISSMTSYTPTPLLAQYSSSKVFLNLLTKSIREEVKSYGVIVKLIKPFIVKSKMTASNNFAYYSPLAQTPEDYAAHLVPTITNNRSTCGYWFADLFLWPSAHFPHWYGTGMARILLSLSMKKVISLISLCTSLQARSLSLLMDSTFCEFISQDSVMGGGNDGRRDANRT